jgi:hypothetical protein
MGEPHVWVIKKRDNRNETQPPGTPPLIFSLTFKRICQKKTQGPPYLEFQLLCIYAAMIQ